VEVVENAILKDLAFELIYKGYEIDVAYPNVFVDNKKMCPFEMVNTKLKYKFCK